ncbi:hypothetical protein HNV12_11525 [Methanococcoides sp. SA1]|nr:hypothetical protein [Methanococcoides sp. SA1]
MFPSINEAEFTATEEPVFPSINEAEFTATEEPVFPSINEAEFTATEEPVFPSINEAEFTATEDPVFPSINEAELTATVEATLPPIAKAAQEPSKSIPNKKGKGFLASITDALKKITQKKKLIDRMEELQPIVPENTDQDKQKPAVSEQNHKDISSENKAIPPIDISKNVNLDDIRTVIPIENAIIIEKEEIIEKVESSPLTLSSEKMEEMKNELADSKQSQESLFTNIGTLSGNIGELEQSLTVIKNDSESTNSSINARIEESTDHITKIEERIGELEDTLENIHSDNSELKTGLTSIEENIAELTSSHAMIFSHIQKITEFGNSRSAEIFETNDRIDKIDESLTLLTQVQGESQNNIQELRSVASEIIRSLEKAHNTNKEFKAETGEQTKLYKDELESLTEFVEKEFKAIGARSYKSYGENVHLNNIIKNSTNMKLCMEWLEFLMELVGCNHLSDILAFYEELGWINEDVRVELIRYAEGIDYYIEKSDWKLPPDDHVKSIWFIEQLAGLKVDKNRLSIIEKDIKKIKMGTEIYGI